MTIAAKITELYMLKAQLAEIKKKEIDPLDARKKELEHEIMSLLDEQGTKSAGVNGVATVSISETIVPTVEDWTSFHAYIRENNAFFLLNRATNAASYREALGLGNEIPGVTPFTKRSLSVRKAA